MGQKDRLYRLPGISRRAPQRHQRRLLSGQPLTAGFQWPQTIDGMEQEPHGTLFAASLTDQAAPAHAAVAEPKFANSPSPALPQSEALLAHPARVMSCRGIVFSV
jgi:hypothetical protein